MIKIKSLMGHSQVGTACQCLGSLRRHCQDSIAFIIHDDGTLTKEDKEQLSLSLGSPEFVDRSQADQRMASLLQQFPACAHYRDNYPMGLKLFDVCLLHDKQEKLYFCDSDVLFLRPFHFPAPLEDNTAVFMQDAFEAFSLRPWHIKPLGKLSVISRLNSGMIITSPSNLDLARIESFLGDPKMLPLFKARSHWIEQTCWSILASQLSTYFFDSSQVYVASKHLDQVAAAPDTKSALVAIHFVSPHRHKLGEYVSEETEGLGPAVTLKLQKAKKASFFDLLRSDAVQRLNLA